MIKLFGIGFLVGVALIIGIWISASFREKKQKKQNKEDIKKVIKAEEERNEKKNQINTGDIKSDFDNSVNILQDLSNKRKS